MTHTSGGCHSQASLGRKPRLLPRPQATAANIRAGESPGGPDRSGPPGGRERAGRVCEGAGPASQGPRLETLPNAIHFPLALVQAMRSRPWPVGGFLGHGACQASLCQSGLGRVRGHTSSLTDAAVQFNSVQFSSVAQSCLTLCNPMASHSSTLAWNIR